MVYIKAVFEAIGDISVVQSALVYLQPDFWSRTLVTSGMLSYNASEFRMVLHEPITR